MTAPESENIHFEKLIEAVSLFRDALSRNEWQPALLHAAVTNATALGFYRNQAEWTRLAAILDEVAKKSRPPRALNTEIIVQLNSFISMARRLKDRRPTSH